MPTIATINIDREIGRYDQYLAMFGEAQPCFSSTEMQQFLDDNQTADEIKVILNTNGGSTTEGFAIYDMLVAQKASGKKIITCAYKANSIGTVIFCAGDERQISKNAEFYIHNPAIDPFSLPFDVRLTADELKAIEEDVRATEDKMYNFYVDVLKLDETKQAQLKDMLGKETDLGSDGALDFGFATSIIGAQTSANKAKFISYSDAIAAIIINHNKNKNMDIKAFKEQVDALKTTIKNGFKALGLKEDGTKDIQTKATMESLNNGTNIYFAEDAIADGIIVYSDEAMETLAPAGDYTLANGDSFTVDAEGKVSNYKESEVETDAQKLQAANAKIQSLEAQLAESKNAVIEAKKPSETVAKQLVDMNKTIETLSKFVPGDNGKNFNAGGDAKTQAQKDLEARRATRNIGR